MKLKGFFRSVLHFVVILIFLLNITLPHIYASADVQKGTQYFPENYFEDESGHINMRFSTHLPLIILESQDDIGGDNTAQNAVLTVIDNGSENLLNSLPEFELDITIKPITYETEPEREKKDYFFSVDGTSKYAIAGMSANKSWILLGGMYDKSLIRNYIGYTLASNLMENVPDVRFCELVIKEGGLYLYQGVYLLAEGDLPDNSIAMQRTDNYGLNTPHLKVIESGVGNFVLSEYWEDSTSEHEKIINGALETVSGMFYAEDTNHFLRYGEIIDKKSFIAFFLINEWLGNYVNMNTGIYVYNKNTKLFAPGYIWNFERSLDNQIEDPFNVAKIDYQNAPFYNFMVGDGEFIDELIGASKQYMEYMDSSTLNVIIDQAVKILGTSQMRDWYRWEDFYSSAENALEPYVRPLPDSDETETSGGEAISRVDGILSVELETDYELTEDMPPKTREFGKYEQEIIKLRFFVNQRPDYVRQTIPILKNQEDLLGKINAYRQNTLFAALFLTFLAATIFLTRRNSA